MTEWEYRKIDLNQQRPRSDELDMLNGREGSDHSQLARQVRPACNIRSRSLREGFGLTIGHQDKGLTLLGR